MHRFLSVGIAVGLLALVGFPSSADDSTAVLAAGGIVLTKGTPIRMKSEDLFVSPDHVRVRFEFVNDSAKDINTIVAFPLPDIDTWHFWGSGIGSVTRDPVNFVGFKATADGKPIVFKVEQRAMSKGKDVTALLRSLGAAINPVPGDGYKKLEGLPIERRNRLIAAGIAMGDEKDFVPQWLVQTRFYWTQRFPAHKTIVIEHSYEPVTGAAYMMTADYISDSTKVPNGLPGEAKGPDEFCFDKSTDKRLLVTAMRFKKAYPAKSDFINVYTTDYILSTARNWSGPIGRFHLTLDKLKPGNVLSLCWDGAFAKSGPSTFTFTATNFVPTHDIHMAVYSPAPSGMPTERPR
jgi:hypothetical protein